MSRAKRGPRRKPGDLDAAYRAALGLTDGEPIPKTLGSVSGRGKVAFRKGHVRRVEAAAKKEKKP